MIWNKTAKFVYALCALMAFFLLPVASQEKAGRTVVCLDGTWDITEGNMAAIPEVFPYKVPVPGLVDMSSPDFFEVGIPSPRREAFWYHKTFQIEGPIPDVALLKVHKAKYGTKVFLNGQFVDEHQPCFTPGYFNLKEFLKGNGEPNQLVIRIGAHRESLPKTLPTGWDFEKYKYIPGIYDSVELILSGTPFIQNIQTAPLIQTGEVRIQAEVRTTQTGGEISLPYRIREAQSGSIVAQGQTSPAALSPNSIHTYDFTVAIPNARLWSPEDPFLYRLELETPADTCSTRFAMRSFQFDATTRRALLNGKPYMLRGTNVCIYRFFEDAGRGNLPWNKDWVRDLHTLFKDMNWNSIRYCIGFPPEFWYDICDELGILIQDEFPIWFLSEWPEELKADAIAKEYEEWMRERWNHPCVVIWDAQNESNSEETGKALMKVRHLDLSNRPWDNGWATPQRETDTIEVHPYFFISDTFNDNPFKMETLADHSGIPGVSAVQKDLQNPMILNEYAWLWLNRDGSETSLTRKVYHNLLGPNSTTEQRREIYARYLAAQTEFWR
ncbi:MAG: glycoside hydrolase family 2 TIM barrel-domain containing protein, partial [bacterium]|nr:glycoside hydrolase family 2 TIM barrel-domain containing protein [bacterium]